jgi:phosphoserine phosphatase
VEGIDALAEQSGKGWRVRVLTQAAMDGDVELEEIYGKRLQALNPTRRQIRALRQTYKQHLVPDAADVIAALHFLGHEVYILSGGLAEAVVDFGIFLGVPPDHVRAVAVDYDQLSGDWWQQIDDERPHVETRYLSHSQNSLTISDGKASLVNELIGEQPGRSILIGDGVSDLLASRAVDLFVGFGGVESRRRVQSEAPIYFNSKSLAPILAITSGPAGLRALERSAFLSLAKKSKSLVQEGALSIQSDELKKRFDQAWRATY